MSDSGPMRLYKGAPSQWGSGKVHVADWHLTFQRWYPACQRPNPLKGGHDIYDGHVLPEDAEVDTEVTCKRCLQMLAELAWSNLIYDVQQYMFTHQRLGQRFYNRWNDGVEVPFDHWHWRAERAVKDYAVSQQLTEPPERYEAELVIDIALNYGRSDY